MPVHGAWLGRWCWERITPLMEQVGHTVLASDLPGHGDDTTPVPELSLQTYADTIGRLAAVACHAPIFIPVRIVLSLPRFRHG